LRQDWIDACLNFNEQAADMVITQAFAIAPPELVCFEILQSGLSEIGQRWFQGTVSVQQEHFATAQAIKRLHLLLNAALSPSREGVLLAVCPAGETHEFGLLLAALLLRRQGWEVIYLGANVPLMKLEATIHTVKPVLSLAIAQTLPAAKSLVELASFLDQFKVSMAFGGGIFKVIPSLVEHIPGHYLGEKIEDITKVVERLVRAPQSPPQIEPLKIEYEKALKDYQIKRSAIETSVIQSASNGDINNGFAKDTRDYIFDHIEAGLAFGEIEILEWPLAWLKEFITTFEGLENHYHLIIQSFIRSLDEHMQENGRIIIEFLRREIN
ncbi:MAG: B12-binding domain-containing protein, partial [Anaerolineales bacterium]